MESEVAQNERKAGRRGVSNSFIQIRPKKKAGAPGKPHPSKSTSDSMNQVSMELCSFTFCSFYVWMKYALKVGMEIISAGHVIYEL